MKRNKRTPLLQYWSTRYIITLSIGLIIIGILSTLWIRYNTVQKRLESLELLAAEIAENSVDAAGFLYIDPRISRDIERRQRFLELGPELMLFVVNKEGRLVYGRPGLPSGELLQNITIPADKERGIQKISVGRDTKFYILKQTIKNGDKAVGSIFVIYPFREINRNPQEIQLLALMLSGLAVLCWFIIYSLTRKLAKPVKNVAEAAKEIVKGNYDLSLDENVKELELYEMIQSFKDMAERLRQLEALRTELLAGVTHELKTPIASISGLVQAVKEEVVSGQEAKEFLDICSKETARLQKMMEDLLDFNSFVTGAIKVEKELYDLNKLVQESTHQWLLGQDDDSVSINTRFPEQNIVMSTDAGRLQQILYNLFNNAKQAFVKNGTIDVLLYEEDGEVRIDIKDNGPGIPENEQELIFERYFRGSEKKDRIRGLGLGLSFSKMIAKALGGDLVLKSSTPKGTTFTLVLLKQAGS